jgi:hypothetical protein
MLKASVLLAQLLVQSLFSSGIESGMIWDHFAKSAAARAAGNHAPLPLAP